MLLALPSTNSMSDVHCKLCSPKAVSNRAVKLRYGTKHTILSTPTCKSNSSTVLRIRPAQLTRQKAWPAGPVQLQALPLCAPALPAAAPPECPVLPVLQPCAPSDEEGRAGSHGAVHSPSPAAARCRAALLGAPVVVVVRGGVMVKIHRQAAKQQTERHIGALTEQAVRALSAHQKAI